MLAEEWFKGVESLYPVEMKSSGARMPSSDYALDLSAFSLAKLRTHFETAKLLPSQHVLQEEIDTRFACSKRMESRIYSSCKAR